MPELPEVEHVRLGLEPLLGTRILRARCRRRDVVRDRAGRRRGAFPAEHLLASGTLVAARRHGKQLALIGSDHAIVLVHLGMSGQLLVLEPGQEPLGGHAHADWSFEDGRRLVFRDPRRFGGLWLLESQDALNARWSTLGPDGLSVSGEQLEQALGRSRRALKAGLLDQRAVAGVGNIYADESLFHARLAPHAACSGLRRADWSRLSSSIRLILSRAIRDGGSTLRDYRRPDGSPGDATRGHRVYGRAGLPCTRCEHPLKSTQIAQRTTVWCPACQEAIPIPT